MKRYVERRKPKPAPPKAPPKVELPKPKAPPRAPAPPSAPPAITSPIERLKKIALEKEKKPEAPLEAVKIEKAEPIERLKKITAKAKLEKPKLEKPKLKRAPPPTLVRLKKIAEEKPPKKEPKVEIIQKKPRKAVKKKK